MFSFLEYKTKAKIFVTLTKGLYDIPSSLKKYYYRCKIPKWGIGLDFSLSCYVIRIENSSIKPFRSYTSRDYALVDGYLWFSNIY